MRRKWKILIGVASSLTVIILALVFSGVLPRPREVEYPPLENANITVSWLDNDLRLFANISAYNGEDKSVYVFQAGVEFVGKGYTAFLIPIDDMVEVQPKGKALLEFEGTVVSTTIEGIGLLPGTHEVGVTLVASYIREGSAEEIAKQRVWIGRYLYTELQVPSR